MLRNDLIEKGYHFKIIEPKKPVINLIWAIIALLFIAPAILIYFSIFSGFIENIDLPLFYIDIDIVIINIIFVGTPLIYFVFKEILTFLFCSYKKEKIEMKLYSETDIPIGVTREAFKPWQIIRIYLIPLLFIYPLLIITGILSGGNINLLILTFIMSFFMSFDLTLVIYVLYIKIRYDADYIAIKNHVYMLTLYSKKYIERKEFADLITANLKKIKRKREMLAISIEKKMPAIKIISICIIFIGLSSALVYYLFLPEEKILEVKRDDFDSYLEYINHTPPVIKSFDGDILTASNIIEGDYTGCAILAGRNIIYCGDNGSVIYSDSENNAVMRLDTRNNAERLCIYEDCKGKLDEYCGHLPDFISKGCYSDGVLYGVQSSNKNGREISHIIRYDIGSNIMDKLIEFEIEDESTYVHDIFIQSKYLYVVYSSYFYIDGRRNMANLTIARIDLENEDACIVYSDNRNPNVQDKIEGLMYNNDRIISSSDGILYRVGADMSFTILTSFGGERIQSFNTHAGNIYYLAGVLNGYIFDMDKKAYQTELLIDIDFRQGVKCDVHSDFPGAKNCNIFYGLVAFCIDGDFIYWTVFESHNIMGESGLQIGSDYIEDGIIYRARLDNDPENNFIDFHGRTPIYMPESGYSLGEWNIQEGYIYAVLYSDDGYRTLSRTRIGSSAAPYVFWRIHSTGFNN